MDWLKNWIKSCCKWIYTKLDDHDIAAVASDYTININYTIVSVERTWQKSISLGVVKDDSISLIDAILQMEHVNSQVVHTLKEFEN